MAMAVQIQLVLMPLRYATACGAASCLGAPRAKEGCYCLAGVMGNLERMRGATREGSVAVFSAGHMGAPLSTAEHVHGVSPSLAEEASGLPAAGVVLLCWGEHMSISACGLVSI